MKTGKKPDHFPAGQSDGPWGVGGIGMSWYVIHKDTGRAKYIGRACGKTKNYFDEAMKEAARRNQKESA